MSRKSPVLKNIGQKRPFLTASLLFRLVVIGLLLLLWGRLLDAANRQSVTFDESLHLLHGVLFWQKARLYSVVQNPPLINALMGLPGQLLFHPVLPQFETTAIFQDWLTISQAFVWQVNSNGLPLLWTARWVIMLLTLLLGAMVCRFSGQLFGSLGAGLLALTLLSLDPNILAHGALATTDLGIAFFLLLAVYFVWRYWQQGEARPYSLFGAATIALGLAFAAKFTAVIFIPALFLLILYRNVMQHSSWRVWIKEFSVIAIWVVVGVVIFLGLYRFQWPALLKDFQLQQEHQFSGHSAFLHGQLSREGWWYYFPLTFLLKTPLATLLLVCWGMILALRLRGWPSWASVWLLLPVAAIFGSGFVSHVNIGYRYLLPALPLLLVLSGNVFTLLAPQDKTKGKMRPKVLRFGLGIALLSLFAASLAIQPNYLAYFNILIGGPANGWQWLVDSNLDWGQDLIALAAYEKQHLAEPYQVAWLGTAPLEAYGIANGRPMPIWPQGREDPLTDPFYPPVPAPGTYVLSATQLQGVYLKNQSRFAWFQDQAPTDRIGYSLFVYDVLPTGPAVGLGLSGIGPAMIAPEDYVAAFASNDVQSRWFDARTSLLWSVGGSDVVWTAVGEGHLPDNPLLTALYPEAGTVLTGSQMLDEQTWRYTLFAWPDFSVAQILSAETFSTDLGWSPEAVVGAADWAEKRLPLAETAVFNDTFALLGYQVIPTDESVMLLGFWQVVKPPSDDLKIFVHLLDEDGQLVSQHDGLDVNGRWLQTGDLFAQLHVIPLPADLAPGTYALQMGLYHAGNGLRLPLPVNDTLTDRVLLQTIEIGE